MIHHLSIPARDTATSPTCSPSSSAAWPPDPAPYPDSWIAWAGDVSDNPMQRFGEPREVAALVTFPLSGEAPFINGAVISIDGGEPYKY